MSDPNRLDDFLQHGVPDDPESEFWAELRNTQPQARWSFQQELEAKIVAQRREEQHKMTTNGHIKTIDFTENWATVLPRRRYNIPMTLTATIIVVVLVGLLVFAFNKRGDETISAPQGAPPQQEICTYTGQTVLYTVQAGDSLASIATQMGVNAEDIIAANCLDGNTSLQVGQPLNIPVLTNIDATAAPIDLATSVPTSTLFPPNDALADCPYDGGWFPYFVEEGDTLFLVAAKFEVDPDTLLAANCLNVNSVLQVGTMLRIPVIDGNFPTLVASPFSSIEMQPTVPPPPTILALTATPIPFDEAVSNTFPICENARSMAIAGTDLRAGTLLTADMLALVWTCSDHFENTLIAPKDADGLLLIVDVRQGMPISTNYIMSPNSDDPLNPQTFGLESGNVAISFPMPDDVFLPIKQFDSIRISVPLGALSTWVGTQECETGEEAGVDCPFFSPDDVQLQTDSEQQRGLPVLTFEAIVVTVSYPYAITVQMPREEADILHLILNETPHYYVEIIETYSGE